MCEHCMEIWTSRCCGCWVVFFKATLKSVDVLDLFSESPCWKPSVDMLVRRKDLGVGVINNVLYVVSYMLKLRLAAFVVFKVPRI